MANKPTKKRSTKKLIAKPTCLRTRKRLLETLLDSVFDGMPQQDANAIAELLCRRACALVEKTHGIDSTHIVLLHPTHPTTQLLNAINAHLEVTDEDGEQVVARLISTLGSQAAFGSQPN